MKLADKARVFAAFEKVEEQDDGTVKVWGIASSETPDSDNEIIKATAMRSALPDWMSFGNIREMHQPIAAGVAIEASVDTAGVTHLGAHIVDPSSVLKVRTGVLKGFSIGGKILKRNATNKRIVEQIKLTEISLVDRPANPDAMIALVKFDGKGKPIAATPDEPMAKGDTATVSVMKKGMYDVAELASLITQLNWLREMAASEALWEGDNSDIPARITAQVVGLCDILRDMVDEETRELLGLVGDAVDLVAAAAKASDLAKKGAKFSKATAGVLADIHKAIDGCSGMLHKIGYAHPDNQTEDEEMTDAEKAAHAADLQKAADRIKELETTVAANADVLAKATKAAEDATAAATTATAQFKELSELVDKSGVLAKGRNVHAVTKTQDTGAAPEPLVKTEKPTDSRTELAATWRRPLAIGAGAR